MRFICLSDKSVVDLHLSDHDPLVKAGVCSFNLLCKGEAYFNDAGDVTYTNNGFKKNETDDEYEQRLIGLISVIEELYIKHNVRVFAFQEAPPLTVFNREEKPESEVLQEQALIDIAKRFYLKLAEKIPSLEINEDNYRAEWKGSDTAGLLVVADKCFKITNSTTHTASKISESNQDNRYQSFEIARDNQVLSLYNFHGGMETSKIPDPKQQATKNDIESLLKSVNSTVVVGDFNLAIPPSQTGQCFNQTQTNPKIMPIATYDGIYANRTEEFLQNFLHHGVSNSNKAQKKVGL